MIDEEERPPVDYRDLVKQMGRVVRNEVLKAKSVGGKTPRIQIEKGRNVMISLIIDRLFMPSTLMKSDFWGLPEDALMELERASKFSREKVAVEFLDWYFYVAEKGQFEPKSEAPFYIDLALAMIACHVEKGFDPPWIDKIFSNNLLEFYQGVNQKTLQAQKARPLKTTARALYEILLAWAYPGLADPAIKILHTEPGKPVEPEKPTGRKRTLKLAEITDPGAYRQRKD